MKIQELQEYLIKYLQKNVTQSELAKALDINKASVSSRFKRNSEISFEDKKRIETYYNISLNEFEYKEDCITVERIHINPSCGQGTIVIDEAEVTPITLGKKLIQNIFKINNIKNLKVFTASGDSMEPTIYNGDDILVDIGDLNYQNGGIFIIEKFGDWFIKRLRLRFDGNLDIISDNKEKYPIETIKYESATIVNIKGRVIKNLSRGL